MTAACFGNLAHHASCVGSLVQQNVLQVLVELMKMNSDSQDVVQRYVV
jgi:hypothetical protein